MKAGFIIENYNVSEEYDSILVSNYPTHNEISNTPAQYKKIKKSRFSVGVWKIKKLKQ